MPDETTSEAAPLAGEGVTEVDGPAYNAGRAEGRADLCASLRTIVDPTDTHHWNQDGLLAEVRRLWWSGLKGPDLTDLVTDSHERSKRKGWWDDCSDKSGELYASSVVDKIPEKLALIHSEVSEALEGYREGALATKIQYGNKKPCGFPSELADICIRVFDLAGALGIDLEEEILLKAAFNETRPVRHGGKKC
jgi:NTP pyrophosphatase (non-canonical NTP hydrolase)